MKELSNISEIDSDDLRITIFQRLLEVEVCQSVCRDSLDLEDPRRILDLEEILSKCIETWRFILTFIIYNNINIKIKNELIIFGKILNKINIFNIFPSFVRKYIGEEKNRYIYFLNNELKDILHKNIEKEKSWENIENEIYLFIIKSKNNIKEYVESFSQDEKKKIIKAIYQNQVNLNVANDLVKSIRRIYYDENLEEKYPEVMDIFDSRIEKLNEMFQSQQIAFKNKIIDLEESIKNQRDELKSQTEINIQTLKENFEGQVGNIGMEKALNIASSRIRNSRRLAFIGFILGLILLFLVGCSLLFSNLGDFNDQTIWSANNIIHTLGRYIAVAAIVWWTWFIAKRVSQLVKIEEDYAFKETIVLFYKAHREEVADDESLFRELLQLTIKMFAENPTRLLEKKECALPVQELVEIISGSFKSGRK